jgi:Fe-S-cluster containining protein
MGVPDDDATPLDEVIAVYRDLARRPVERACALRTGCCRFRLTGLVPYLTRGEALLVARAVRRTGRVALRDTRASTEGDCPLLDDRGRCTVYDDRPFGCRTHFCREAGGPYARQDVIDLIRRLEAIDTDLGGDGGKPLPGAVAWALRRVAQRPKRKRPKRN